ncbi:MAG: hypothetical protein AAGJ31_13905, partial [Verrucomicrobiota bacterium]
MMLRRIRMAIPQFPLLSWSLVLALAVPSLLGAATDKVVLKSGTVLEGTILEESPDQVRIEVLLGSIKEKKTVPMSEVERIEKAAPDDIAFGELSGMLPTPSLLDASKYAERLSRVNAFLTNHPTSKHQEAVKKMQSELQEEEKRVKAGDIKLKGEWITAEVREAHRENIEADIFLSKVLGAAKGGNYLAALRALD